MNKWAELRIHGHSGDLDMQRIIAVIAVLSTAILGTGCKSVSYNPSYTRSVTATIEPRYHGTALVYTTPPDDQFVFRGHPDSLAGVAWTLKAPLGEISKKIAGDIYGHLFDGGYNFCNTASNQSQHFDIIIHPRVVDFDWRMNQAKNLGFAITPQVKMTLQLELLSPDTGSVLFHRLYESGWSDGPTYVASLTPLDSVNAATHQTMAKLMVDSIRDLDSIMLPKMIYDHPSRPTGSVRRRGSRRSMPSLPLRHIYAGLGSGHWIIEVFDDGNLIELEDESLWKVSPIDVINSALWLPTTAITVIDGDDPEFPYKLVDTDDDEVVSATISE